MLITWNRAFCRGDVKLLTKDIDVRWQAWFAPLVDEIGDVTKQPMALAMRFLGYHCPMPACRYNGFCSTLCGACKNGQPVKGKSKAQDDSLKGGYSKEQATVAFNDWRKQSGNAKKSRAIFVKAHPEYDMMAGASSGPAIMNPHEAMEWLARHQTVVLEPTGAFGEL